MAPFKVRKKNKLLLLYKLYIINFRKYIIFLLVLDNWTYDILSIFPNYNVYKLAILYWLQSPHSKGASLLCHQVIQKPNYPDSTFACSSSSSSSSPTPTASYSIPSTPESNHADDDDNDDPLTLTIEPPKTSSTSTPSILDGYTPTLQPRTPPSIITTNTITTEKQVRNEIKKKGYMYEELKEDRYSQGFYSFLLL